MYQIQEWLFAWYNLENMAFDNLEDAQIALNKREQKRIKSNKRIRKQDFKHNGYGVEADYPVRIIEI